LHFKVDIRRRSQSRSRVDDIGDVPKARIFRAENNVRPSRKKPERAACRETSPTSASEFVVSAVADVQRAIRSDVQFPTRSQVDLGVGLRETNST